MVKTFIVYLSQLKHSVHGYVHALEPTSLKLTAKSDLFYFRNRSYMYAANLVLLVIHVSPQQILWKP